MAFFLDAIFNWSMVEVTNFLGNSNEMVLGGIKNLLQLQEEERVGRVIS